MKTEKLAKMYDLLTLRERLPLIVAAIGRGDEVELQRLIDSAPFQLAKIPAYYGLSLAMAFVSVLFVIEQLNYAASFGFAAWQLDSASSSRRDDWRFLAM